MNLRPYRENDAREIAELFHDTFHSTNSRDYTREQLAVWAPHEIDYDHWERRLRRKRPIGAEMNERIVGFAEWDPDGHSGGYGPPPGFDRCGQGERSFLHQPALFRLGPESSPSCWIPGSLGNKPFSSLRGCHATKRGITISRE